jgi:hypothetical protein
MASTIQPVQTRYNTPYDQTIFDFNTIDSKVYLSRETNKILNIVGNDVVIKDMHMTDPIIIGASTVRASIGVGFAIRDETLIKFTNISTVDIDCASLGDTTVSGCHLGIFMNYQYLQTMETNNAKVEIYHIAADGTVTNPLGTYNMYTCRLLLGVINFTKSGANVTEVSRYTFPTLLVSGSTMYVRGEDPSQINLPNLFKMAFREYNEYFVKRDFLVSE